MTFKWRSEWRPLFWSVLVTFSLSSGGMKTEFAVTVGMIFLAVQWTLWDIAIYLKGDK